MVGGNCMAYASQGCAPAALSSAAMGVYSSCDSNGAKEEGRAHMTNKQTKMKRKEKEKETTLN